MAAAVGANRGVLYPYGRIPEQRHITAFVPAQQVHRLVQDDVLALVAPGEHRDPRLLEQLLYQSDEEAGESADQGETDQTAWAANVAGPGGTGRRGDGNRAVRQQVKDKSAYESTQKSSDG